MLKAALIVAGIALIVGCSGGSSGGDNGGGSSSSGGNSSSSGSSGGSPGANQAPAIQLRGAAQISVPYGGAYSDQGADARDAEDGDLTDQITVAGLPIDTKKPGTNTVTYRVADSGGKSASVQRSVIVESNSSPQITVNGGKTIRLVEGDEYIEMGASATDREDGNLNDRITTASNVDSSRKGQYEVTYSVQDSVGATSRTTRQVLVTSPGPVTAILRSLTRVKGVSPETVYFSAQSSVDVNCQDLSGGNDDIACATGQWLAFHFDFDDPDSGSFDTTGRSRNRQIGGAPRAIHTFVCTPESSRYANGVCTYHVGVRAENPNGEFDDDFLTVEIQAQDNYYKPSDTICVSPSSRYTGCPTGAERRTQVPSNGEYSGKRVLLNAGESHGEICIGFGEKNVTIDRYGTGARPVVPAISTGLERGCNDSIPDNESARTYDMISRDVNGHIAAGWAYNITVTRLKVGQANPGMAGTLQTFHDLDMDWSQSGEHTGSFHFATSGKNCAENATLDCSLVPWPYGIFLTDSVLMANPSNLPNINTGCVNNCQLVNSGMAGVNVKTALEHNGRFMGAWGFVASNVWFRGNHIGGRGPKARLYITQTDYSALADINSNPEDFSSGGHIRKVDITDHWTPHYNFFLDSKFNDTEMDSRHESGSFTSMESGHFYSGMFGNEFLINPNTDTSNPQLRPGGVNVVALDNQYNGVNLECRINTRHDDGTPYHDSGRIYVAHEEIDKNACASTPPRTLAKPNAPGS